MRIAFIICLAATLTVYTKIHVDRASSAHQKVEAAAAESTETVRQNIYSAKKEIPLDMILQDIQASPEPSDPANGSFVLWMSNGEGAGDKGNIMLKISADGKVKTVTMVDFRRTDDSPLAARSLGYLDHTM